MADHPLPDLILYGRAECGLCDEARELVEALLADRRGRGLPTPALVERDIDADPVLQRQFFATVPVVELGGRRIETVISLAALRSMFAQALDREPSSA